MKRSLMFLLVAVAILSGITIGTPHRALAQCSTWVTQGSIGLNNLSSETRIAIDASDNIYMVNTIGTANRVMVMKYNGVSWSMLDTTTLSHGIYPQIALDASGVPYVSYTDGDGGDKAIVKKYNGSTWTTVGGTHVSSVSAWFTSLCIDAGGNVWLSYTNTDSAFLSCAKFNGSSWSDVSPSSYSSWGTSMALDPSGKPYVATQKGDGKAAVLHYNGSTWDVVGADGFSGAIIEQVYFSLAVDGSGIPYMTYTEDEGSYRRRVMKFNGSSWVSIAGADVPQFLSIAVDASGAPYVAETAITSAIRGRIIKYNGSTWDNVGDALLSGSYPASASIVFNSANTPFVVYTYPSGVSEPLVKKLVAVSSTVSGTTVLCNGATTTLSNSTAGGSWLSAACNLASVNATTGVVTALAPGSPVINYRIGWCNVPVTLTINPFAGNIIGERTVNAGSTTSMASSGSEGGTWSSSNTSVATVGASGVVAGVAPGTATITYTISAACGTASATALVSVNPAAGTCQAWNRVGSGGGPGAYNDHIAFDRSGVAYVAISDAFLGFKITVKKLVGGVWTTVGAPGFSDAGVDYIFGFAVQPDGTPFVAYNDAAYGGALTVKKFNGSSWVTVGSPGFTSYGAERIALAVSACGTPYVSTDGDVVMFNGSSWESIKQNLGDWDSPLDIAIGNDDVPCVVYRSPSDNKISVARYVGSEWVNVGEKGFSPEGADDAVISVGNNRDVYAAYTTSFPASVKIMKYNGSSWTALGSVGDTVYALSLDVDAAGTPYVCYDAGLYIPRDKVVRYHSGTWEQVAASDFGYGNATDLALSPDGVPYITLFGWDSVTASSFIVASPGNFSPVISGNPSFPADGQTVLSSVSVFGIWTSSDPSVAESSGNWVYGIADGTATMTYTTGSCSTTVVVTVGIPCDLAPIAGSDMICTGATTTFTDTTAGGSWLSTDETVATVNSSGIVSGVSEGIATIYYYNATCEVSKTITVNATSSGAITGTATVCIGNTTTLGSVVSGGTWSSSNTAIATVGAASGVVSGVATGNATITYTATSSCGTSTATRVVTVNAASSAGTITGVASLCAGNTTTLDNAATGGTWTTSNTAIATVGSATGVVSGIAVGNATITYTVTSGCGSATTTAVVTVNGTPSAGAISGAATVCPGSTTTLGNAATGGNWSSSNSSIATVGSVTGIVSGIAAGNATITYTVANGCGSATSTKVVTVNAAVSAGTITGASTICTGATTTLGNTITGGTWSSSNGAVATVGATTGIVTGAGSGNATITYIVSGACGSATATKVVTIGSSAAITGALSLCAGMTSSLSGGASGGTWSSSNTAVATIGASTGVLTAVATGTANITYSSGTGCTATAVVGVSAPALISGTATACVGQTSILTDATPGGTWTSSNTSLATVDASTGVVTGMAAGTATISYVVSAGCYRTSSFIVKALPPAVATPVTVCVGSTLNVPPPSSNGLSWTSSNTSVATIGSSSGVLTGLSVGTATLTYTTNTGCFVTTVATVNMAPAITGATSLCTGSVSTLSSAITGGVWNSSSASVAAVNAGTGAVTGGVAGTATVTYTTSGCRSTTVVSVSALAAITGSPSLCLGASVALGNTTTGGTWSSSNSGIASVDPSGVVTGVAGGTATITYTLASGCTRTIVATVSAASGAISGALTVCPGATTSLSAATPGGTWSGGNTAIATINSTTGVVTGVGAGTINVSYTLTGCRATAIATVNPLPAVIAGTLNACVAQTATLTNATADGTWASNNTAIATIDPSTGEATGVAAGTVTMTYTLSTGCNRTGTFTVKALPPAIATPVAACVGTTTSIGPPSTNGKSWSSSNTAVGAIGSGSGILTGVSTGTTTLTYTTTTGCFVTTEATVYVTPTTGVITGPSTVVMGNTITLDDAAGGGVWSSSNTARASIGSATGIVTGVGGGTATISYSVSNPGCTVRATKVISVTLSRPEGSTVSADNTMFRLYPNPTTGNFTVEVEEAGTFSIFTVDGREICSQNINTGINPLTLSNELASGIYMCRFTSESGNTTMVRLVYER